jgi:hypothetical protein
MDLLELEGGPRSIGSLPRDCLEHICGLLAAFDGRWRLASEVARDALALGLTCRAFVPMGTHVIDTAFSSGMRDLRAKRAHLLGEAESLRARIRALAEQGPPRKRMVTRSYSVTLQRLSHDAERVEAMAAGETRSRFLLAVATRDACATLSCRAARSVYGLSRKDVASLLRASPSRKLQLQDVVAHARMRRSSSASWERPTGGEAKRINQGSPRASS